MIEFLIIIPVVLACGAMEIWHLRNMATIRNGLSPLKLTSAPVISKTVELVGLLLDERPDEWYRKHNDLVHDTGIKIYIADNKRDYPKSALALTTLTLEDKNGKSTNIELSAEERTYLYSRLWNVLERKARFEQDEVSRALAQRIIDRENGILAQPRLGYSGDSEGRSLDVAAKNLLTFDSRTKQIVEVVRGDSGQISLDAALKKRYSDLLR